LKYSKIGITLAGVNKKVIHIKRQAVQKQVNGYNYLTAKKQTEVEELPVQRMWEDETCAALRFYAA